jgi:hypothetical protein
MYLPGASSIAGWLFHNRLVYFTDEGVSLLLNHIFCRYPYSHSRSHLKLGFRLPDEGFRWLQNIINNNSNLLVMAQTH